MGRIALPRRFESQPQGAVEVDWPEEVWQLFTGNTAQFGYTQEGSTASEIISGLGKGIRPSSSYTTQGGFSYSALPTPATADGVTLVAVVDCYTPAATNQYPSILYSAPDGDFYGRWNLSYDNSSSGTRSLILRLGDSVVQMTSSGEYISSGASVNDGALTTSKHAVIVAAWDKITVRLGIRYIGGLSDGLIKRYSFSHASNWRAGSHIARVGSYFRSGWRVFQGGIYLAAALKGVSSESRERELLDNPWQLFKAPSRTLFFDLGAGGGAPTLSLATYVPDSITTSGAKPRVTLTF